jgi:hypothetical protein
MARVAQTEGRQMLGFDLERGQIGAPIKSDDAGSEGLPVWQTHGQVVGRATAVGYDMGIGDDQPIFVPNSTGTNRTFCASHLNQAAQCVSIQTGHGVAKFF